MKKKCLLNILFVMLALLLVASCKSNTEPEKSIAPETENIGLLPLKVGNTWEYQEYSMNSDGTVRNVLSTIRYNITETVNDPNKRIFEKLYKMKIDFKEHPSSQSWIETEISPFFRNYNDGLYIMGGVQKNISHDSIFIKTRHLLFPVKKGEIWRSPSLQVPFQFPLIETYLLNDTTNYSCVETDADFETPLGVFRCIVVYHQFLQKQGEDIVGPFDIYEYFNEKFGLIGCITKNKSTTYRKQVLISTNLISK